MTDKLDISKGTFQPDRIVDGYTFEHPNFTYGFTLHNKVYSASLHQERKYLDFGFRNLIDEQYKYLHSHQLFDYNKRHSRKALFGSSAIRAGITAYQIRLPLLFF